MKDCRFLQLPHPWISYFKTFLDSLCAVTDETDAATGKEVLNPVVVRVGTCPVECHFDLHSSKVALWWCCCCWWSTSMLFEVVIICSYSGGGPGAVTAIVIGFGECWLKEKKEPIHLLYNHLKVWRTAHWQMKNIPEKGFQGHIMLHQNDFLHYTYHIIV